MPIFFAENVTAEGNRLQFERQNLQPFTKPGENYSINYKGAPTMQDGKVCTILSEATNSFQSCPCCGATPTQMSKAKGVLHSFKPYPNELEKGIRPLHVKLRAFDYFCKNYFHKVHTVLQI